MTDVATTEVPAKPKAAPKPKAPPAAPKPELFEIPEELEVGDVVIFSPPQSAVDTIRSLSGVVTQVWASVVTHVFDKERVSLKCFRPFNLSDITIRDARYDPNGTPGTFKLKAPKA